MLGEFLLFLAILPRTDTKIGSNPPTITFSSQVPHNVSLLGFTCYPAKHTCYPAKQHHFGPFPIVRVRHWWLTKIVSAQSLFPLKLLWPSSFYPCVWIPSSDPIIHLGECSAFSPRLTWWRWICVVWCGVASMRQSIAFPGVCGEVKATEHGRGSGRW